MTEPTEIFSSMDPVTFLRTAVKANNSRAVKELIAGLPIVDENAYTYDPTKPERGWKEGHLHWYPVGGDRGNAGRIKLAGSPENPLAERIINAIESLIELERQIELARSQDTPPPSNPREAIKRYFQLPPLDELPAWRPLIRGMKATEYGRELAKRIRVRLIRSSRPVEYTVLIEDDGIGQQAGRIHSTLLSLGRSDKPDKPFLMGVFGQGGSSAYAASEFSWIISRRAPEVGEEGHDLGWTVIKHVYPIGRRDDYWAYLAANPDGRVPALPISAAEGIGFKRGAWIAHVNYNFGRTEPARTLYQALNHLLFNPVLPYELYTRPAPERPDPMWGNGYRLSRLGEDKKALDKKFEPQSVGKLPEVD